MQAGLVAYFLTTL